MKDKVQLIDGIEIVEVNLPEVGYLGEGCPADDDCPFDECGCGGSDQY